MLIAVPEQPLEKDLKAAHARPRKKRTTAAMLVRETHSVWRGNSWSAPVKRPNGGFTGLSQLVYCRPFYARNWRHER